MDENNIIRGQFGFAEQNDNLPLETAKSLYNIAIRRLGDLDDRIHRLNDEIKYCRNESRSLMTAARNLRHSIEYQQNRSIASDEAQKNSH